MAMSGHDAAARPSRRRALAWCAPIALGSRVWNTSTCDFTPAKSRTCWQPDCLPAQVQAPSHRRQTTVARIRRRPRSEIEVPESLHVVKPQRRIDGTMFDFSNTEDKVVFVCNTATMDSQAEYHLAMLTELHERYRTSGLMVIAYPSNWFAQKEPGTDEEIAERMAKWNPQYTIMSKGANFDIEENEVLELGRAHFPGEIIWNFHGKYLFGRDGLPKARFDLLTTMDDIEVSIQENL